MLMLPAAARQMCPHGPWGCLKTAHTYADKAVTLGHKKARRERGRSWSHAIPARSSRQVNVEASTRDLEVPRVILPKSASKQEMLTLRQK